MARQITVRMAPRIHEICAREASQAGESLSAYIEMAALTRAIVDRYRRDPDSLAFQTELVEAVKRYAVPELLDGADAS